MHVRPALIAALCLTLGILGATGPSATPALPDTAEGLRLSAFMEAARAGTEDAVRVFIEKNFSPQALKETPVQPRLRQDHQPPGAAARSRGLRVSF